MTLPEFFQLVERFLKARTEAVTSTGETSFVDEFILAGNSRLKQVIAWEPQHQFLRQEHGREVSATKEDKTQEIITILSHDPEISLENMNVQLKRYGMSLGIIDKIHVLMSQRDHVNLKVEHLMAKKRELARIM